jgi:hypothetical protein
VTLARRSTFASILAVAASVTTAGVWRSTYIQPASPEASPPPPVAAELQERLVALRPDEPTGYLELAEELADRAESPEELAQARTLYVLAFELARSPGAGIAKAPAVAASACLGLAELERLPQERRWLRAIAGLQDPRYATQDWNVPAAASPADETAYRAASVLGLARSGDGRQAQELLDKPGVRAMLQEYERAIGDSGFSGAMSRLEKYLRAWPCPECQNRRFVNKPADRAGAGPSGVEARVCFTCKANPGPPLENDELLAQLGFEALLLNGVQRSWAAQLAVDQAAPLRDPDPSELAPTYRVDPKKVYWRAGHWLDASETSVP